MIDQLKAWKVDIELEHRFVSATTDLRTRRLILICLRSGVAEGWGEVAPVPGHTRETVDSAWASLADLAADRSLALSSQGPGMLGAGLSQAKVALAAHLSGKPLWRYLGGTKPVAASAAIGIDKSGQPDRRQLEEVKNSGYCNAKLKIDSNTDVGDLGSIVAAYPEITFGADANGSLDLDDDSKLAALDALGLSFIEQPGNPADLEGHRRLCSTLGTPIALDESADSIDAIREILRHGAADIVNLKTGRFGTLRTIAIAREIVRSGLRVRLGGLIESGIGRSHTIAAATTGLFAAIGDIAGSDRYFSDDLMRPQCLVHDGTITPSDRPGIGVVDVDAVEQVAVDSLTVARQ